MKKILLLCDTHSFIDENITKYAIDCDEIWHAGDFGNIEVVAKLQAIKPLIGVFGNIDGQEIRNIYPEINVFMCEDVKVMIKHIGGYPPKYNPETKKQLLIEKPQLFISGHSHILKIIFDNQLNCLHINPGAAGKQGWHKVKTIVRFTIDGATIKDAEIIEIGKK